MLLAKEEASVISLMQKKTQCVQGTARRPLEDSSSLYQKMCHAFHGIMPQEKLQKPMLNL